MEERFQRKKSSGCVEKRVALVGGSRVIGGVVNAKQPSNEDSVRSELGLIAERREMLRDKPEWSIVESLLYFADGRAVRVLDRIDQMRQDREMHRQGDW